MRSTDEVIQKIKDTLTQKGEDYGGPTYRRVATALSVPPQYSILVRILEKCFRVQSLLGKHIRNAEHLREEFIDIACYAVLAAFESEPLEQSLCSVNGCSEDATFIRDSDKRAFCYDHYMLGDIPICCRCKTSLKNVFGECSIDGLRYCQTCFDAVIAERNEGK